MCQIHNLNSKNQGFKNHSQKIKETKVGLINILSEFITL